MGEQYSTRTPLFRVHGPPRLVIYSLLRCNGFSLDRGCNESSAPATMVYRKGDSTATFTLDYLPESRERQDKTELLLSRSTEYNRGQDILNEAVQQIRNLFSSMQINHLPLTETSSQTPTTKTNPASAGLAAKLA